MCGGCASTYCHKPMVFCYFFGGIRLFTFFRLHRSQVLNYAVMCLFESFFGVGCRCTMVPKVGKGLVMGESYMLNNCALSKFCLISLGGIRLEIYVCLHIE